jgi:sterol desaturase/sphingolipid hydroxylase (fatty acid hydroxylase superfamily)
MLSFFTDPYFIGFVIIGLVFSLFEYFFSYRKEKKSLNQSLSDFAYQLINYKLVGAYLELAVVYSLSWLPFAKFQYGEAFWEPIPIWIRFVFFLIAVDFCEYLVHNLLHRVPFLWEFHKVHHAIPKLDWWGNMHFHPLEIFIYKFFLYVPLIFLQPLFPTEYFLHFVLLRLAIGSLAHTNLNINLGPLNYLINNPTIHRWHHAAGKEAVNKNLGVTFTAWDFIFGTALYPKNRPYPEKGLGFPQSSSFSSFFKQLYLPFIHLFKK